MRIHVLVLNYNGRHLMEECLPSVVEAAEASRYACDVAVIDNDSTDDSVAWLAEHYPKVETIRRPNRGLCSFNDVVPTLEGPVAILLNNDIKLDRQAVDPLVRPLVESPDAGQSACFLTAPLCWRFDGGYEGFRTAVRWRWGLVQATAFYPGHEPAIRVPGLTASAGAALAVDRARFTALGGFDPRYLPGRLEDVDFALRGYLAGYHGLYVPEAVVWHLGMATFGRVFGPAGCDQLALRNTLLFQWKNLRHPAHLARQAVGFPLRLLADVARAPWTPKDRRFAFTRALRDALEQTRTLPRPHNGPPCPALSPSNTSTTRLSRERDFFRRFHPRHMMAPNENETAAGSDQDRRRARSYPISRWYLRPAADRLAAFLVPTPVRPVCLTLAGLLVGLGACGVLAGRPAYAPLAAVLVLAAWFFDRADGQLARRQQTVSAFGAWLDANVDELLDVAWHGAVAAALVAQFQAAWPWLLTLAFVAGKYLFMHGLATEEHFASKETGTPETGDRRRRGLVGVLQAAWHLPGNADVRIHLLVAALLTGCLAAELALVAVYYNLRWVVRFGLVARRLGGGR